MTSTTADVTYTPAPSADFVLPFELPALGLRGRLIRLDSRVEPRAQRASLARACPARAGRGARSRGPARLGAEIRGPAQRAIEGQRSARSPGHGLFCRRRSRRRLARLRAAGRAEFRRHAASRPISPALAGSGALAITIEPKKGAQTYQGLVPLSPDGLSASAETYFFQSEQLPTALRLSAGPTYRSGEGRGWRAGALMVQAVPGRGSRPRQDHGRLAAHRAVPEDARGLRAARHRDFRRIRAVAAVP